MRDDNKMHDFDMNEDLFVFFLDNMQARRKFPYKSMAYINNRSKKYKPCTTNYVLLIVGVGWGCRNRCAVWHPLGLAHLLGCNGTKGESPQVL